MKFYKMKPIKVVSEEKVVKPVKRQIKIKKSLNTKYDEYDKILNSDEADDIDEAPDEFDSTLYRVISDEPVESDEYLNSDLSPDVDSLIHMIMLSDSDIEVPADGILPPSFVDASFETMEEQNSSVLNMLSKGNFFNL